MRKGREREGDGEREREREGGRVSQRVANGAQERQKRQRELRIFGKRTRERWWKTLGELYEVAR